MAEKQKIDKGLKHLQGSEKIIGNIVAYCVSAHKADPSEKTMTQVRQYVSDTANSVCSHVLTIAQSINTMIDKQTKEIQEMSFEVDYVQHRVKSHQTFMSSLYMTKFQTCPRPQPQIKIMREIIPTDQLPKYARPKKPWVRQTEFNYDIFNPNRKKRKNKANQEGNTRAAQLQKQKSRHQVAPKASVVPINLYGASMDAPADQPVQVQRPISPKTGGVSLYKSSQQQRKQKVSSNSGNAAAPPMMSSPPPSFSSAPPSMSQMEDDDGPAKPPPIPPVPPN